MWIFLKSSGDFSAIAPIITKCLSTGKRGDAMITMVLVVFIIIAVAFFSAQNATPVAVSFLSAHFEASLAIVVVLSFLTGMVLGMVLLSWMRLRRSMKKKKKERGTEQTKIVGG
jgi:uncharacterized integral membrane protein